MFKRRSADRLTIATSQIINIINGDVPKRVTGLLSRS
jgi:hypothetical protein